MIPMYALELHKSGMKPTMSQLTRMGGQMRPEKFQTYSHTEEVQLAGHHVRGYTALLRFVANQKQYISYRMWRLGAGENFTPPKSGAIRHDVRVLFVP